MKNHSVLDQDVKIAVLESNILGITDLIKRNEKSVKDVEKDLESKYEKIERGIHRIEEQIWSLLLWTIGGFAGVFGLLAHIKGWI